MKKMVVFFFIGAMLLTGCNLPQAASPTAQPVGTGPVTALPATLPAIDPTITPMATPTEDLARYDLLIVAPAEFAAALTPLIEHKNRTGMPAKLVTLDEVDKLCPGRDQAEQVKRCLAMYQKDKGIRYAMLVGNAAVFPVRYTMADIDTPEVFNTAYYGTDLYYADLYKADGSFDDWDSNGNGIYGEIGGEMRPGLLNIDHVDLNPDIAVGRVPASDAAEVATYVNKVIGYELSAYHATWAKRLLLISSSSFDSSYCNYQETVAGFFPSGMDLVRLYAPGNPCASTQPPDAADILQNMNQGAGLVSYIGHGNMDLWADAVSVKDIADVQNEKQLSIVFAGGCGTGTFTIGAPGGPYVDINGQVHAGAQAGETFASIPPPPAVLQPDNAEGMMKYMLVQSPAGAVDYIGAITGAQFPALFDLNTTFFKAIANGDPTVGDAWNSAIRGYYALNQFDESYTNADWYILARFHQPWKFLLFGDPSLRIGGVPAS
jgi:hypothetical protein